MTWRELEERVGLENLPAFHRAFLRWRGVEDPDAMPLRRVQQRVEAELNRMAQRGDATRSNGDWDLQEHALATFEAARAYLD